MSAYFFGNKVVAFFWGKAKPESEAVWFAFGLYA
jgi:hypothetical protein